MDKFLLTADDSCANLLTLAVFTGSWDLIDIESWSQLTIKMWPKDLLWWNSKRWAWHGQWLPMVGRKIACPCKKHTEEWKNACKERKETHISKYCDKNISMIWKKPNNNQTQNKTPNNSSRKCFRFLFIAQKSSHSFIYFSVWSSILFFLLSFYLLLFWWPRRYREW